MPRIRTVKPEFWEDDTVGSLSFGARLLFIATWNLADDEGLLRWTPAYIKAQVFMYDDEIDVDDAERFMGELVKAEVVFPYRGGKSQQRLAYIINFHKHQRINRPSPAKLPPPSLQNPQVLTMYAERDQWVCHICSEEVQRQERHWHKQASIDHVHPRAKGGTDYPSNLGLAHVACNSGKRDSVPLEPVEEPSLTDSMSDSASASLPEGKGRERKGDGVGEGDRRESTEVAPIASSRTNPVWNAFADIFGEPPNRAQQKRRGKNVRDVTESLVHEYGEISDDTAYGEVGTRAQAWPLHFGDATLTEEALAKHFTTLGRPPLRASEQDVEKHRRDLELAVAQEEWERTQRKAIGQ